MTETDFCGPQVDTYDSTAYDSTTYDTVADDGTTADDTASWALDGAGYDADLTSGWLDDMSAADATSDVATTVDRTSMTDGWLDQMTRGGGGAFVGADPVGFWDYSLLIAERGDLADTWAVTDTYRW